eukprot:1160376-Pelagomonas_calceolata.AAC.3
MTQTFQHILPVSKPWHDKGQCSLAFAKHAHAGEHARAHHTHTHTHTHRHKYKHVLGAKLTMCIWTDVLELVCMPVRMCRYGPRAGGGRDDPERSTASNGAQVRAAPQPFTAGSTAAGSASAGEGAVCFKATMRGLLVRGAGGNPSRSASEGHQCLLYSKHHHCLVSSKCHHCFFKAFAITALSQASAITAFSSASAFTAFSYASAITAFSEASAFTAISYASAITASSKVSAITAFSLEKPVSAIPAGKLKRGAARSMTRPMSAQPPSSQPRSKLIEQYIEAQRIRPQSVSGFHRAGDAHILR